MWKPGDKSIWRLGLCSTVAILALSSCQQAPATLDPLPPPPTALETTPTSGALTQAQAPRALIQERSSPKLAVRHGASGGSGVADVTLNFVDVDVREVARTILGQILKVNYTIDPNVHGTTTIETPSPMRRDQLIPTLVALLNQNGATLLEQSGMYRVLPLTSGTAASNLAGAGNTGVGTELVPLSYASARELAKVLTPYVGDGAKITPDATRNALIVSGDPNVRTTVVQLVRAFDVDVLAGQSYALFPVTADDPTKLAGELQKALHAEGNDSPLSDLVRVIPMERVNGILVVAAKPRYIEEARRIFSLMEQGRETTARTWHVYYVQNGQANDLANLLQRAFTPGHVTTSPTPTTAQQNAAAPGLDQASVSSATGNGNSSVPGLSTPQGLTPSSTTGAFGFGSQNGTPPSSGTSPASEALSTPDSGGSDSDANASSNTNTLRILPDTRVNAVLIYATAQEQGVIESMLHKVDILPLQVRIDATIAEVTLNDSLQYGTQFFFKNGGINGALNGSKQTTTNTIGGSAIEAFPSIAGNFPGFVFAKATSAVQFALSALQSVSTVKVLSSPQVLVLNNQQARLQVGDLVPYLSQSAVSTQQSNAPIVNSINYQQTGVILEVTPRVNAGGLVTLDIEQQVSDVATTTSSTIDSPTFQQREVRSRVIVQDGQTLGLAGLIRDNVSRDNEGIPVLKDIPVLGSLFSTQTNSRLRTELMVLITPHVVDDERAAWALTQDLRAKLNGAAFVPGQLQKLPASGSSNPNGAAFRP